MKKVILAMAAAAAAFTAIPATAQTAYNDWETFQKDGRCWASTVPLSSSGSIAERQGPFLSIQNHPGEGVRSSVSLVAGFPGAAGGDVKIDVDGEKFEALSFGGAAFTASGKPEAQLIAAMRRGKELTVTWTDPAGASAVDRYSLVGFVASKNEIDRRCN